MRSEEILTASLLTLARTSGATLVDLPLLLTNPAIRRALSLRRRIRSSLLVWCSFGQVVMGGQGGAAAGAVGAVVGVEHVGQVSQGGLGEVAAFAVLPLLVALAGRSRSGG